MTERDAARQRPDTDDGIAGAVIIDELSRLTLTEAQWQTVYIFATTLAMDPAFNWFLSTVNPLAKNEDG